MAKQYFTRKGFSGLTTQSQMIDVAIFIGVGLIAWFIFKAGADNFFGIIQTVLLSIIIAWIAQLFLPKATFYRTINNYYCSDCGQYLGNSPKVCGKCGCNRYTTKDTGVGQTIRNR
ncbi:MAG: hypothetical protein NTX65_14920 [Ignavibacteriales bacterium]|nr:hypothetical protein [Ignavibacteriales bacterium]